MAASNGASSSGLKSDGDEALSRAMQHMELHGGELDDVFVGEEVLAEMKKEARWLAVARVNTNKNFSIDALFQTLRYVWNLAMDPELQEVDDNLFTFKFFCLGDWNKVMNQGPWLFRKLVVVIAEYDGLMDPASIALNRVAVWAQIHSIPVLYRKTDIIDQLARRIGQVKSVEIQHPRWFEGDYIRVRAIIDVNDPLIRWTPLNVAGTGRTLLHVKYEKIGYFCDVCGVMGHDLEECGDGVHKPENLQYGKWMLAKRREQPNSVPSYRGSFPVRGGGRGRGGRGSNPSPVPRKRSSGDADLDKDNDLRDTAVSPMKTTDNATEGGKEPVEEIDDPLARKNLGFEHMVEDTDSGTKTTENLGANTPWLVSISDLKTKERKQKLSRYRMKKFKRKFGRKIKEGHGRQPAKNTREVRQDAPSRHAQAEEVKSWEDHRGFCEADEEDKVVARNYATAELPVKLVVI
ncbi:hypothetical protein ACQ4PT_015085 [Festuca glaucescens]